MIVIHRLNILLSESLDDERRAKGLSLHPQPYSLQETAQHLRLDIPRSPTALLHRQDEEAPLDMLSATDGLSALVVPVERLTTGAIHRGFTSTLNNLRRQEQGVREEDRATTNRAFEFAGVLGGLIIAGASHSTLGTVGGLLVAGSSGAARLYSHYNPVACQQITDLGQFSPPVLVEASRSM